MKILIINTFYYPNMVGGTENSIKILAENLKRNGHEIAIYSLDSNSKKIEEEEINDIKVFRGKGGIFKARERAINNERIVTKITNKLVEMNNFYIDNEIEEVCNKFIPDIIHTNNLYGVSTRIWKIASKRGIPIVHTLRDYWLLNPLISNKKLFRNTMKINSNKVNYVTAPSAYTLNKFLNNNFFQNAKSKVIYNAVDLDIKQTQKDVNEKRATEEEQIRFMYVGMLVYKKGITNMLEAFSEIENKNISLHIYGDGELKEYVENMTKKDERIKYYGKLSKEQLDKEWIKNDVLIVPSIWEEPFGRVVIEANQHGLPVIGSNKGGIKEIINLIGTGEICDSTKISQLQENIKYFSNRKNLKKYYDKILNNIQIYSSKEQANNFIKIYEEILNRKEKANV